MTSMLYVKQSLAPDEELVHVGSFHWMYTFTAVLGIVWGLVGSFGVIYAGMYYEQNFGNGLYSDTLVGQIRELHPAIKIAVVITFALGLWKFASMMIIKATTEIAITTSRLIYKRGLVARTVGEMSIDRIEGVNVLQGIIGRILNYGRVMVRGMGVGEVVLPPLADPISFRKAIEKARTI